MSFLPVAGMLGMVPSPIHGSCWRKRPSQLSQGGPEQDLQGNRTRITIVMHPSSSAAFCPCGGFAFCLEDTLASILHSPTFHRADCGEEGPPPPSEGGQLALPAVCALSLAHHHPFLLPLLPGLGAPALVLTDKWGIPVCAGPPPPTLPALTLSPQLAESHITLMSVK